MQNFEGPEKKFELLLNSSTSSLRERGDQFWSSIVSHAGANILSRTEDSHCISFLLSESSLFVYDQRVVMITCGQTTLVNALIVLLDAIPESSILSLMFERKNENFPENQVTTFEEDVSRIKNVLSGDVHIFGERDAHFIALFHSTKKCDPGADDVTIEVLMHDISATSREAFRGETSKHAIHRKRFLEFLKCSITDEYYFEPEGYSLNGLNDGAYSTLHVTPQRIGSFVSFESNISFKVRCPQETIHTLLELFEPLNVGVLCFGNVKTALLSLPGYEISFQQAKTLPSGYDVQFIHATKA